MHREKSVLRKKLMYYILQNYLLRKLEEANCQVREFRSFFGVEQFFLKRKFLFVLMFASSKFLVHTFNIFFIFVALCMSAATFFEYLNSGCILL